MPSTKTSPVASSVEKFQISAPLEAGPSILDSRQLPPHLSNALEYISSRLAQKRLHLTLIAVRKDAQIPQSQQSPPLPSPASSASTSVTSSPAKSVFSNTPSTATRTHTRTSSFGSMSDVSSSPSQSHSRTRWPSLPANPKDNINAPISPTTSPKANTNAPTFSPASPISSCPSPSSSDFSTTSLPPSPNPYGICLIHASTMTPKAEKILRYYISRADKKFGIGSGWLSAHPLSVPITCNATNDLIRRSLCQNSILFTSEGLTLLELDHVYTFKCHLNTYARTLAPADLMSAVDELRRLVLARQGRRITKGYLLRAYDWLSVSLSALVDVDEGYKVAYGGKLRWGGIEVLNENSRSPPPLKTNFGSSEIRQVHFEGILTPGGNVRPVKQQLQVKEEKGSEEVGVGEVQVGESARGLDKVVSGFEYYSRLKDQRRGSRARGGVTPNGSEDITPVTKGEWLCLMMCEDWKEKKTAPVVLCT